MSVVGRRFDEVHVSVVGGRLDEVHCIILIK